MAEGPKGEAMRVDTALVKQLAKLLDEANLTEIEVEDGGRKIKVKREAPGGGHFVAAAPAPAVASQAPTSAQPAAEPVEAGTPVKSPMVGTAFLSPEPDSKPFVSAGDKVKAGDTLMIIEAMKVMNPITAPAAGTISKILVADAQPVEFDQVLVVIG